MIAPRDVRRVEPKDFVIYSLGVCYASVCSSLPVEEVVARVNEEEPTGIASPWRLSPNETFHTGEANGMACPDLPDTHRHWLMEC